MIKAKGLKGSKTKVRANGKHSAETKDAAEDREAAAKAKEAEVKTQEVDPKAKDAPTSQPSQKEDLTAFKAKV